MLAKYYSSLTHSLTHSFITTSKNYKPYKLEIWNIGSPNDLDMQ